jgi:hypothetical protein
VRTCPPGVRGGRTATIRITVRTPCPAPTGSGSIRIVPRLSRSGGETGVPSQRRLASRFRTGLRPSAGTGLGSTTGSSTGSGTGLGSTTGSSTGSGTGLGSTTGSSTGSGTGLGSTTGSSTGARLTAIPVPVPDGTSVSASAGSRRTSVPLRYRFGFGTGSPSHCDTGPGSRRHLRLSQRRFQTDLRPTGVPVRVRVRDGQPLSVGPDPIRIPRLSRRRFGSGGHADGHPRGHADTGADTDADAVRRRIRVAAQPDTPLANNR